MEKEDLNERTFNRGKIIEDVSVIEESIGIFISIHYFAKINEEFIAEVLEDESFGLQLLKNILGAILKSHHPDIRFPFSELDELQGIRNIIAHAKKKIDATYYTDKEPTSTEPYYMRRGKKRDAKKLEGRFYKLKDIVRNAIVALPNMPQIMREVTPAQTRELRLINGKLGFRVGSGLQL